MPSLEKVSHFPRISFLMPTLLRAFLILACIGAAGPSLLAQKDLGPLNIGIDLKTIPIRVSGTTPELNSPAKQAFAAEGRYRVVTTAGAFALQFSPAGANQVSVAITRGAAAAASQTFTGTSMRNALFKAADFAVEKTSGLKGFFASR